MNKQNKALPLLISLNACDSAKKWAGDRTVEEAWRDCPKGEWLLWFYAKTYQDNKRELSLAKGHCANTIRHLMTDERSLRAVDAAIAYGEGKIDDFDLFAAATSAYTAAYTFRNHTNADAYYIAYYAANIANNTASGAAYVANAASCAIFTHAIAAKAGNQRLTADICRKYLQI